MAKYVIGGIEFSTKALIYKYVREIVARYPIDKHIIDKDLEFILALFNQHPHWAQKEGIGIAQIVIHLDNWNKKAFKIIRTGGSQTDISWVECISPASLRQNVLSAFRSIVVDQVIEFKVKAFQDKEILICPITNQQIDWHNCDIDHPAPNTFNALAEAFCISEGIQLGDIVLCEHNDGNQIQIIKDNTLAQRWWKFHKAKAQLRVVSLGANRSILRRR